MGAVIQTCSVLEPANVWWQLQTKHVYNVGHTFSKSTSVENLSESRSRSRTICSVRYCVKCSACSLSSPNDSNFFACCSRVADDVELMAAARYMHGSSSTGPCSSMLGVIRGLHILTYLCQRINDKGALYCLLGWVGCQATDQVEQASLWRAGCRMSSQ